MIGPTLVLMLNLAGAQQIQAPATEAAQPPAGARRICRNTERVGSILPTRICRPASYWARIDREQNRITDQDTMHMRNNSRTSMRGAE